MDSGDQIVLRDRKIDLNNMPLYIETLEYETKLCLINNEEKL